MQKESSGVILVEKVFLEISQILLIKLQAQRYFPVNIAKFLRAHIFTASENAWKINKFSLANLLMQPSGSFIMNNYFNPLTISVEKIHLYWNFQVYGWNSVNEILLKMSFLNKHMKYSKNKTKEINAGQGFCSCQLNPRSNEIIQILNLTRIQCLKMSTGFLHQVFNNFSGKRLFFWMIIESEGKSTYKLYEKEPNPRPCDDSGSYDEPERYGDLGAYEDLVPYEDV